MTTPDFTKLDINDFTYELPDDRIAKFPMDNRDESKLLVAADGKITDDHFKNISSWLPDDGLLILNNTRVVRARILFKKVTGALIEIFCLEPVAPTSEIQLAFQQTGGATWKCLVGNARRWKADPLEAEFVHEGGICKIIAEKGERDGDAFLIHFSWNPETLNFAEVLESIGKIPLPPYLHRDAVEHDNETYQTVYAKFDGSVAAPTAGLHFTEKVFESLSAKNITQDYVTLHVGAGTFKPVGDSGLQNHEMHTEQIILTRKLIEKLMHAPGKIIAVGTTSVRTLESLYWFGVKLCGDENANFRIEQFDPYNKGHLAISKNQALEHVLKFMKKNMLEELSGETQLMIVPGYQFKIVETIITNFHQPRSTLLLLISAWLGESWKDIYQHAMDKGFRFLSYGDSCLFL